MKQIIITVDGPAASGKEKISKYICRKWKFKHLDSGILYRRLAYIFMNDNVDISDNNNMIKKIKNINSFTYQKNKKIRTQEISILASKIAVHKFVRDYINKLQRDFVYGNKKAKGFVIDGRDIGSVVFKKANLKLFIEVNAEIRAKRRYKQLIDSGEKSIYPKILKEIKLRDKKDINRINSPLVIPKDAYIIKNDLSFSKTVKEINKLIVKL